MYILLIIHIFISILFCAYNIITKQPRDASIYKFLVVFLIPVFGAAYFIILAVLKKFFHYDSTEELLDYSKYIRSDIQGSLVKSSDINKEINIISADEALVLNESKIKRKLIIDLVKENSTEHISILKKALENEDTEVSHYAATAITEFKNYYIGTLQQASVKYEKDKTNVDALLDYVSILKNYLDSTLLDATIQRRYKYLYSEKLGELLSLYTSEEKYFIDKINCDIELGDYNSSLEYCSKFSETYNESEAPYIMYMKLYYILKDSNNFKIRLKELEESNLQFTNKTLNIFRFWKMGG